jgi:glycopeptide antibiotics resistance protein
VLVFSLGLSLVIEGGQLYSGRRTPDVDDLILNSLGGFLGYLLSCARRA